MEISAKKPNNVDEYIAGFPNATQLLLKQLRKTILESSPKAEEKIGYGMPSYIFHGRLLYFAGYKNHIGFYPMPSAISKFRKELSGYKTAKGSIRFPLDKPLPVSLVKKIVLFRAKENTERESLKKKNEPKLKTMRHSLLTATLVLSMAILSCQSNSATTDVKDNDTVRSSKNEDQTSVKVDNRPSTKDTIPVRNQADPGGLSFLREYKGKYPADAKLFEQEAILPRLKKLLGDRYQFMYDTWGVESPIEIQKNIFVATACEPHNCGNTNFAIVIDLEKNLMWAGIREENKVKLYSEDGSSQQDLEAWSKQ